MTRDTSQELRVDILRCDAYGYCAEMLSGIVERDEWGYPIVTRRVAPDEIPSVRRAVAACPKLALRLTPAAVSDRVVSL